MCLNCRHPGMASEMPRDDKCKGPLASCYHRVFHHHRPTMAMMASQMSRSRIVRASGQVIAGPSAQPSNKQRFGVTSVPSQQEGARNAQRLSPALETPRRTWQRASSRSPREAATGAKPVRRSQREPGRCVAPAGSRKRTYLNDCRCGRLKIRTRFSAQIATGGDSYVISPKSAPCLACPHDVSRR
jgi:hypothetical protein